MYIDVSRHLGVCACELFPDPRHRNESNLNLRHLRVACHTVYAHNTCHTMSTWHVSRVTLCVHGTCRVSQCVWHVWRVTGCMARVACHSVHGTHGASPQYGASLTCTLTLQQLDTSAKYTSDSAPTAPWPERAEDLHKPFFKKLWAIIVLNVTRHMQTDIQNFRASSIKYNKSKTLFK